MSSALWLIGLTAAVGQQPLELEKATTRPDITKWFTREDGWTGGDGAYSVRLGPDRLLWLFGDSWIGKIENGRRKDARMVNNAVALQSLRDPRAPLRFFWGRDGDRLAAFVKPAEADRWYWPQSGAFAGDRLYVFCAVLRRRDKGPPGFQFEQTGNDLLRIANPSDEPTAWRSERMLLPAGDGVPQFGSACLVDGDYLYVCGLFPPALRKSLYTPLAVTRIALSSLAKPQPVGWEYWCKGPTGERWSDLPADLVPLFGDAAPEMSVTRVRGIDGYVATYTMIGLSRDIAVRHAARPEGPWSAPLKIYHCPEAGENVYFYSAKAHPDLADRDGQLVLTYCRNAGDLGEHMRRPEIYVPQGVEVMLRRRADRGP
jgi:hypothetical protein